MKPSEIESGEDILTCERLRCRLQAKRCVERQAEAQTILRALEFNACRECPDGTIVAERTGLGAAAMRRAKKEAKFHEERWQRASRKGKATMQHKRALKLIEGGLRQSEQTVPTIGCTMPIARERNGDGQ